MLEESVFDNVKCNKKAKVYVKINDEGFITDVGSDVFIDNLDGWIMIDEGEDDRYVHAQTSYFEKPLVDDNGNYRYKKQ